VRREELLTVHTAEYLNRLRQPAYVAAALEVPTVRYLPAWLIDRCVLRPMRWATMGTVLGASEALRHGLAVNLGGGFHHAKPAAGEGFCIYSDIALAIHSLRSEGAIGQDSRIAYVDLDAHQGNGVGHFFAQDQRVFILDMYNSLIYPSYDLKAQSRIDCAVRLERGCRERKYLQALASRLPGFLDSISRSQHVGLAIYNAGTDVFAGDPLGCLEVSADGVLRRDVFVVEELRKRGIPTLMLLSGGYTPVSYRLVADSVIRLLEMEARQSNDDS
jgi:histone deacetylase 11